MTRVDPSAAVDGPRRAGPEPCRDPGDNGGMSSQPMRPGLRAALSLAVPDVAGRLRLLRGGAEGRRLPLRPRVPRAGRADRRHRPQAARAGHRPPHPRPGHRAVVPCPGAWLGLFVGTIFALFDPSGFNIAQRRQRRWPSVPSSAWSGPLSATASPRRPARLHLGQPGRRRRSTRCSCEHKHVQRGRELLTEMDPMRAAQEQVRRAREAERARRAAAGAARPQPGSPSSPTAAGAAGR